MTDNLPTTPETQTTTSPTEAVVPPPEPTPAPGAEVQPPPPEPAPVAEVPANGAALAGDGAETPAAPAPVEEEALAEETIEEQAAPDPEAAEEPAAEGAPPSDEGPPTEVAAAEEPPEKPAELSNKRWYVVKVQSGREESIKEAIERRVKIEGLEEYFARIVIPVEKYTEIRNSKRVQRTRKLYPGYLMVEVEYNDRILYLFRETSGVGDFVGGGVNRPPPPMPEREVDSMLQTLDDVTPGKEKIQKPKFDRGDRVRVKDGTFAGMEGEVKDLLEARNLVRVELTIFGRPVPVELEYWQVELV
jgi:transcriptional antiterminator NusG